MMLPGLLRNSFPCVRSATKKVFLGLDGAPTSRSLSSGNSNFQCMRFEDAHNHNFEPNCPSRCRSNRQTSFSLRRFSSTSNDIQDGYPHYPSVRLRVKGIRHSMTTEDLRRFFADFKLSEQTSECLQIAKDNKNRLTGCAYVYFDDEEEARRAQRSLHRKYLKNVMLEVFQDYDSLNNYFRKKYYIEKLKRYDYNDVDQYSKT